MAHVILTYQTTLTTLGGLNYRPRACGRLRGDDTWEGWLVPITPASAPVTFAVLDPFSVYAAEGETLLRERLEVASAHPLRQIVRGYGLVTAEVDIATMTVPERVARIIAGVRTRLAA